MQMTQITSSKKEFDRFEERRAYPRITLNSNARLYMPGEVMVDVTLYDIAACSLQVRFDGTAEGTIRAKLQHAEIDEKHVLGIKFALQLQGHEEEISVICTPVYICQIDRNVYAMGLKFSDIDVSAIDEKDKALLIKFIEISLEPL